MMAGPGLQLTWGTSKAVNTGAPSNTPATDYRIEYSDTGPSDQEGYQWRRLGIVGRHGRYH